MSPYDIRRRHIKYSPHILLYGFSIDYTYNYSLPQEYTVIIPAIVVIIVIFIRRGGVAKQLC